MASDMMTLNDGDEIAQTRSRVQLTDIPVRHTIHTVTLLGG